MKTLMFKFKASDEQLKHLRRLAAVTGHSSIRELFGTLVSEGLRVIDKSLQDERARLDAEAVKPSDVSAEEYNMQSATADGKGDAT